MKTEMMKQIARNLLIPCMLLMGISSCENEDFSNQQPMEPGLYINLATGEEGGMLTRAVQESTVTNLTAYYFGTTNTSNQADTDYLYITKETLASTANDLSKPFRLDADGINTDASGTYKNIKVVFLANIVEASHLKITLTPGSTTLDDFRKGVVLTEITAGFSSWGAQRGASTTNYQIPMYVCSEAVDIPAKSYDNIYYINGTSNTTAKTHYMRRMMAKFTLKNYKVALTGAAEPLDYHNFAISEVAVINGRIEGLVCDLATTYGTYTVNSVDYKRVATVSVTGLTALKSTKDNANRLNSTTTDVPSWSAGTVIASDQRDVVPASTATPSQTITFYTFETENVNTTLNNKDNCYIYIKGKRIGLSDAQESSDKEYMIPIYAITESNKVLSASTSTPGPVLRNHHYVYNILGVDNNALFAIVGIAPWADINFIAKPLPL